MMLELGAVHLKPALTAHPHCIVPGTRHCEQQIEVEVCQHTHQSPLDCPPHP
jgi:hypothetical protein